MFVTSEQTYIILRKGWDGLMIVILAPLRQGKLKKEKQPGYEDLILLIAAMEEAEWIKKLVDLKISSR